MNEPQTKTDLHDSVLAELAFDPSIDARDIDVTVHGGVVTLTGFVKSFAQKIAAERVVKRMTGVQAMSEELTIELPLFHRRSDIEIAEAAHDALDFNPNFVAHSVVVAVANGWITLTGTVESPYARATARLAVASLAGVRGVSNEIALQRTSFGRDA